MAENFDQAWVLLGVGMLTVFFILLLVVILGNGIILFINRFFFEPLSNLSSQNSNEISHSKMAVIVAAVKQVTGGKGKVVKIQRK
jgi:Na+-transporting methylmalonyl-CoA/oxaloacetate decarboxylase gamma subunit